MSTASRWVVWHAFGALAAAYAANRIVSCITADTITGKTDVVARAVESIAANPLWLDPGTAPMTAAGVTLLLVMAASLTNYDYGGRRAQVEAMRGQEYGNARWATEAEMRRFAHTGKKKRLVRPGKGVGVRVRNLIRHESEEYDGQVRPDPTPAWCEQPGDDNFILSSHARMHVSANPDREAERNKHVYILGGSGSGKTFNYVGPNLLQLNGSYVVTDPKGATLEEYGNFFIRHGYRLVVVNTKDTASFAFSMKYNPLRYINNQASILTLVNLLIENTSGDAGREKEDFFVKAERQLYCAVMSYVYYMFGKTDPEHCSIPMMLDLIIQAKPEEGRETTKLDVLFHGDGSRPGLEQLLVQLCGTEEEARKHPAWFAITQYDSFKVTSKSPETEASVLASCLVRLAPFAIDSVRDMFSDDELMLERIGEERTAVFLVMSDTDKTFNFILAMLLYQLFDVNTRAADARPGSHCSIPVQCILDEFANIGRIPDADVKIATLRSRWINMHIILQSVTQLKKMYEKNADVIEGNCDTTVFLGRCDHETNKHISERLGKNTILTESTSISKSRSGSSVSTSTQAKEHALLSPEELGSNPEAFSPNECLVLIKNARPYKDDKYRTIDHPRYRELREAEPFSLERWTTQRRRDAELERRRALEAMREEMRRQEQLLKEAGF